MAIRKRSRATSLLALLSVVFLLATACSDDSGDSSSTETTAADDSGTTTAAGDQEPPSESAAASLRSDLVGLLEEQVYLTGFTVESALAGGGIDAPVPTAYATEAGDSADELANILGGAYGVGAAHDFVEAWNDHRDAIVAYGVSNGPADGIATTREAVLGVLADMDAEAAFTDVANSLEESDDAMVTTIDAMVAEQPAAAADLSSAAAPMPDAALDLANTIAGHMEVEGEVDSPESALRADLTGLLQESALLTGLGLDETVRANGDASAAGPAGTFAAVEENTQAIADAMEPDDAAAAAEFAQLWTGHIQSFADYTTALVDDDAAGIQDAQDALVQFRDDVGELLAENYPAFTKELVAEELVDHTDSMLAYADALVREAGDLAGGVEESSQVTDEPSEAPALLRTAALNMRLAARSLTGGLTAPASTGDDEAATTTTAA